jgi:hypothetical protein
MPGFMPGIHAFLSDKPVARMSEAICGEYSVKNPDFAAAHPGNACFSKRDVDFNAIGIRR